MTPDDNVTELPNPDHRAADLTFGGCGNPDCPTGHFIGGDL